MTRQRYGRIEVRFEPRHCLLDSAFETRADGCEQVGFGGWYCQERLPAAMGNLSCVARQPNRGSVLIFGNVEEAEDPVGPTRPASETYASDSPSTNRIERVGGAVAN
jgi:hypothetical protein